MGVIGRIVIDGVRPRTPTGEYPAKAVVGEPVTISADIFKDGHDILAARICWAPANGNGGAKPVERQLVRTNPGLDLWQADITPTTLGLHEFRIEAWVDEYATWRHKAEVKLEAGQDIEVELEEGARLAERRAKRKGIDTKDKAVLDMVVRALREDAAPQSERLAPALTDHVAQLMGGPSSADDVTTSETRELWVDRERAVYGAWYEFFPRSEGGLRQAADKRLPYVADLGFDVVYLPPIHPIGRQFRKGKNNTLTPTDDDVGSPWAIGADEGGHCDVHPDLGTIDDFDYFVDKANQLGLEVALDYALQCAPDHPWVKEHPEWFHHRPDGTIAYAENPPKKYQDIYPLNFWPAEGDAERQKMWSACKEILDHWISHGVRIFRVDNPHTKPMAFWAWCIAAVQKEHPDVILLAEAFTRPKVMSKLAEVGFSQSYTYFTWRTTKADLVEYVEEVSHSYKAEYMRPNFWPNTPDILAHPLRNGPPSAFKLRALLAATLVPSYGMYGGYELLENEPMSDANEEYFHSEKYELRKRRYDDPRSIAPFIKRINEIRKRHPAFARLDAIQFHNGMNDEILAYSRATPDNSDIVFVVVNLDPWETHEDTLDIDLESLGIGWDEPYEVTDELTGESYTWQGRHPYVRLDPIHQVGHVFHVRPLT